MRVGFCGRPRDEERLAISAAVSTLTASRYDLAGDVGGGEADAGGDVMALAGSATGAELTPTAAPAAAGAEEAEDMTLVAALLRVAAEDAGGAVRVVGKKGKGTTEKRLRER